MRRCHTHEWLDDRADAGYLAGDALGGCNMPEWNLPQLVAELVRIPWGHHRFIIDKCSVMSSTKSQCLSEFQITN